MADDVNDQVLPDFVPVQAEPTFLESLGASFRRQNLVGSAVSSDSVALKARKAFAWQFTGQWDEGTAISDDEINKGIEESGLAQHAEAFADVSSREEFEAVKNDVFQEQEDMRVRDASGWMGFGTDLLAGVVDVPTLLPVGAGIKVGSAANSVLGSAARLMGASALETTLTEVGLQSTQQIRTFEESAMNVGGSMVLSSLLGGAVARATLGRGYSKIADQLEADMAAMGKNEPKLLANQKSDAILEQLTATAPTIPPPPDPVFGGVAKAVGSEILDADNLSPSQRLYANSLGVNTVNRYAQMVFGRSIIHEMMAAEAPTARMFMQEVAELPVRTQGAMDGVANPISVQSMLTEFDGIRATATKEYVGAYRKWRGRTLDILGKDYEAFSRRVASAMVNGDDMLDPHVTAAVKVMQDADTKVMKRAVKAGLMRDIKAKEADIEAVRRKRGLEDQARQDNARLSRQQSNALSDDIRAAKTPEERAVAVRNRAEQQNKELFTERDAIAKELDDAKAKLRVLTAAREHPDAVKMTALKNKKGAETRAKNNAFAAAEKAAKAFAKKVVAEGVDFIVNVDVPIKKQIEKQSKKYAKLGREYIMARIGEIQGGPAARSGRDIPPDLLTQLDEMVTKVRKAMADVAKMDADIPKQIKAAAGEQGATAIKQWKRVVKAYEKDITDYDTEIADILRRTEADATRLGEVDAPAGSAAANKGQGFKQARARDPLLWELLWSPERKIKRKYEISALLQDEVTFKHMEARAYLQRREYMIEKGELNERSLADPSLTPKEVRATLREAILHAKGSFEVIVHGTFKGGTAKSGQVKKGRRGSALHRNVALSDKELLKRGWIDNDAVELLAMNTRQLGSDALLAGRFRRAMNTEELRLAESNHPDAYWIDGDNPTTVPDLDMSIPKERVAKEYDQLISNAGGDPGRVAKLTLERDRMLSYIDESIDLLRGTHKAEEAMTTGARNLAAVRNYNFALRMGSNVISSLADVGAIMLRHGPTAPINFWGRRLSKMVKDGSFKIDRADLAREARAAGVAIEAEVQSRVAAQMDLMDPAGSAVAGQNKFQQVSRYLAQAGSKVYLINSWTNAMRRAAFGIYQDRVIRFALDRTTMDKAATQWLADLGISSKHLDAIAEQARKGGAEDHMGIWLANTDKWDNDEIRSIFWAAGRKEVNTANVAPNALEKPRAFQNPILNTLLQFTSFAFASTSRTLGQSAQRIVADGGFGKDSARIYMGISAMVGIGMLSSVLHNGADTWLQRANGTELTEWEELPEFDKNPGFWVYQGMSRSGTLGLFSQFADVFENATGYGPMGATQSIFGDEEDLDPVSRYGQSQPLKNVFGPTAGLANDVITGTFDLTRQATDEDTDLKQKTARKLMRNFMPLLNAFYLKSITKEATRSGLEAMGLEE